MTYANIYPHLLVVAFQFTNNHCTLRFWLALSPIHYLKTHPKKMISDNALKTSGLIPF